MNTSKASEQRRNHIVLATVESTRLMGYGYEATTCTLAVQFPGKPGEDPVVYHYYNVPQDQWKAFQEAESKGSFFEGHIRAAYDYQRIEPETGELKTIKRETQESEQQAA